MTKRSTLSFRHWERDMRTSSWFDIRQILVDEQAEAGPRGFALAFGRLAKARTFRFHHKFFCLRFKGLLLVVVVLFIDQVCCQLVQSMGNSDP